MGKGECTNDHIEKTKEETLPPYIPPIIITYTAEQIVEQIGPALACSPNPCPVE